MEIKEIRRLIIAKLSNISNAILELKGNVKTLRIDDSWLSDGLETIITDVKELKSIALAGDYECLLDDNEADIGIFENDAEDEDEDYSDSELEVDRYFAEYGDRDDRYDYDDV
jgi:hypothetical protein